VSAITCKRSAAWARSIAAYNSCSNAWDASEAPWLPAGGPGVLLAAAPGEGTEEAVQRLDCSVMCTDRCLMVRRVAVCVALTCILTGARFTAAVAVQ
jgi:hypothetical protein